MSQDFKEQVLAAVPIESYIGRVTTLKKKGRYYSGLCPFHKEKTPSFTVTPEKGLYHCFGCGKGGDLFRFVMDYDNVTFPEALEVLGRFAGIEKPRARFSPAQDKKDKLLELNGEVMRRFQQALNAPEGNEVRRYLHERGITSESQEVFSIGFAPGGRDFLGGPFANRIDELRELGLIKNSDDGRSYEFFRERLMFPIRDVRGAVVAFGGRVLPTSNHPAKYLNSSDSTVFHKSSVLYGLHEGLAEIRDRQEAFLVEGYLDVIGLAQGGIKRAVAPMGTALTAEHLKLLRRYARKIVVLLDGDRAGRAAALKSARLIVDHGDMEADLILLSNGLDPFDVAGKASPGELEQLLKSRVSAERFLLHETLYPDYFQELEGRAGTDESAGPLANLLAAAERQRAYYGGERPDLYPKESDRKKVALRNLLPFLAEIPHAAAREFFLTDAAVILSIEPEALREEWRAHGGGSNASPNREAVRRAPAGNTNARDPRASAPARPAQAAPASHPGLIALRRCEESLVLEFAYAPHVAANYLDIMQNFPFQDEGSEIFWQYLENRIITGDIWTGNTLDLSHLGDDVMRQFGEAFIRKAEEVAFRDSVETAAPADAVEELLRDHRIRSLEMRTEAIERERAVAGLVERDALLAEQGGIQKEIRELRRRQRGAREVEKPSGPGLLESALQADKIQASGTGENS